MTDDEVRWLRVRLHDVEAINAAAVEPIPYRLGQIVLLREILNRIELGTLTVEKHSA